MTKEEILKKECKIEPSIQQFSGQILILYADAVEAMQSYSDQETSKLQEEKDKEMIEFAEFTFRKNHFFLDRNEWISLETKQLKTSSELLTQFKLRDNGKNRP